MKTIKRFFLLILLLVGATSCEKEDNLENRICGVWEIRQLSRRDYTNEVLTAETTYTDAGFINLRNEELSGLNDCQIDLSEGVMSYIVLRMYDPQFSNAHASTFCFWGPDRHANNAIHLTRINLSPTPWPSCILTINKKGKSRRKQTWTYTELDNNGKVAFTERYEVERMK